MLKKFLKEVVIIVAGKNAEAISDLLHSKKHVNEFIIAKKLGITINQTRNILYKISDHGLVSSIRKKDKRKGWYTYFWKLEVLKTLEFYKKMLLKNIAQLENQIKNRETKEFYVCERCSIEFNEENALLNDFTCNECGDLFARKDNSKIIKDFKRREDRLRKELSIVEEEIEKENNSLEKVKIKEIKKKDKEKEEKKAADKKIRLLKKNALKDLANTAKEKIVKKIKKEKSKSVPSKRKSPKKK